MGFWRGFSNDVFNEMVCCLIMNRNFVEHPFTWVKFYSWFAWFTFISWAYQIQKSLWGKRAQIHEWSECFFIRIQPFFKGFKWMALSCPGFSLSKSIHTTAIVHHSWVYLLLALKWYFALYFCTSAHGFLNKWTCLANEVYMFIFGAVH